MRTLTRGASSGPIELRREDVPAINRRQIWLSPDDFQAVQSTFIQSRFLKITAIMYHLENGPPKNESFMQRNAEHYSELRHNHDLPGFKAVRALRHTSAVNEQSWTTAKSSQTTGRRSTC
jgi:hypothetical protein